MSSDLALVLFLLAMTVVMFMLNKPRMDAAALIMMVCLPLTGVITMDEALAGFSNFSIVLIAALFVLGEGLVRTGISQQLDDWLMRHAAGNESRLVILMMLLVGALGSIMSPHRCGRDLHSYRLAHCKKHWHTGRPTHDALGVCRLDKRHDDAGVHGPQSGGS